MVKQKTIAILAFAAILALGVGTVQAGLISPGDSATILLNPKDGTDLTFGQVTRNGLTWNDFTSKSGGTGLLGELDTSTGSASGVAFSVLDGGGFASDSRGSNVEVALGTAVFPGEVTQSYIAKNAGDYLIQLRFASDAQLEWDLTLLASRTSGTGHITDFNVGGVWNTTTRLFTGGTTLRLEPATAQSEGNYYDVGTLPTVTSVWDETAQKYVLDLQIGHVAGTGSFFSGMHAAVNVVPEPATMSLLALGGLALIRRRRKA